MRPIRSPGSFWDPWEFSLLHQHLSSAKQMRKNCNAPTAPFEAAKQQTGLEPILTGINCLELTENLNSECSRRERGDVLRRRTTGARKHQQRRDQLTNEQRKTEYRRSWMKRPSHGRCEKIAAEGRHEQRGQRRGGEQLGSSDQITQLMKIKSRLWKHQMRTDWSPSCDQLFFATHSRLFQFNSIQLSSER